MKINVLKKISKKIKQFEDKEWELADKKHYGQAYQWTPKRFTLIAKEDNKIVGSLEFQILVGVAEIITLIVTTTQRGQGVGTNLLQKAEEVAKKHDAHKLYLTTGNGWEAEKFYQKFGMVKTGDMPKHYAKHDFVEYSKFI